MLIKEYRICLPLSVEEYKISQLYMIQKKSRTESTGEGSGVEILVNEPYTDGPGGSGQYTRKIYHVDKHLPGWFRAILPKTALLVEEEAWNAYPYTKTIYRSKFIEKFSLEIETVYKDDGGQIENVFNLAKSELRARNVDFMDIVCDPISDYKKEEDPRLFKSAITGRGPLADSWRIDYADAYKKIKAGLIADTGQRIMCAYKLCRVEFPYWGFQTKIEKFIHDYALRNTMLRAHRQAWAWQDEYQGLTMDDIRHLEKEAQQELQYKLQAGEGDIRDTQQQQELPGPQPSTSSASTNNAAMLKPGPSVSEDEPRSLDTISRASRLSFQSARSRLSDHSAERALPIGSIECIQTSSSDEEFFDTVDTDDELDDVTITDEHSVTSQADVSGLDDLIENEVLQAKSARGHCAIQVLCFVVHGGGVLESGDEQSVSKQSDLCTLQTTFRQVLHTHYPVLENHMTFRLVHVKYLCTETLNIIASLNPYSFDSAMPTLDRAMATNENFPISATPLMAVSDPKYPDVVASTVTKINNLYNEFLSSPEGQGFSGQVIVIADAMGSIVMYDSLCKDNPFIPMVQDNAAFLRRSSEALDEQSVTSGDNQAEVHFQQSASNPDFTNSGPTAPPQHSIPSVVHPVREHPPLLPKIKCRQALSCPTSRRTSSGSQLGDSGHGGLEFEVSDLFMLGSPLPLVLASRKIARGKEGTKKTPALALPIPVCHSIYNLFYPSDPSSHRLEPLIHPQFKHIAPVTIPRYAHFPFGDGQPTHVIEAVTSNMPLFTGGSSTPPVQEQPDYDRRLSHMSVSSQVSGRWDLAINTVQTVVSRWWGSKRLDYALYCPDALQKFPTTALPFLLHSSFWESSDVAAFILRQIIKADMLSIPECPANGPAYSTAEDLFLGQPGDKWRKIVPNLRKPKWPNHRANDVLVIENQPQRLSARFTYGRFDMFAMKSKKVDIHIAAVPSSGEWQYYDTVLTDSNGKITYTIPVEKRLPQGMYPVKMVARIDHTSVDLYLLVLPSSGTDTVVFSIDGSFTASVSLTGKNPKVRPGAVDIVRHWQELGYLILYITARPDMYQKEVVSWLAQHNFPHGMLLFMDKFKRDPLKQKLVALRTVIQEAGLHICAAYGSSKDIWVYRNAMIPPCDIYIAGRCSRKQNREANVLAQGYAAHLESLSAAGASKAAAGNARFFLRKSCFSLPAPKVKETGALVSAESGEALCTPTSKKKVIHKTCSLPQERGGSKREYYYQAGRQEVIIGVSQAGNTVIQSKATPGTPRIQPTGQGRAEHPQ